MTCEARSMKTIRAQDSTGTYRRDMGWKPTEKGFAQHRFYLGRDKQQAELRAMRLERLWELVEARWKREQRTERPVWDSVTLAIGQAIARGETTCPLDPQDHFAARQTLTEDTWQITVDSELFDRQAMLQWLRALQHDFPIITLKLADDEAYQQAVTEAEKTAKTYKRLAEPYEQLAAPREGQTLHQALDAFAAHIERTSLTPEKRLSPTGVLHRRQIRQIKAHQQDMPLSQLGLNEIETLINYWRNRPITKRGTPASPDTVRDVIKRIKVFIKWLHRNPDFHWRKPEDLEFGRIRIPLSAQEVAAKASPTQVQTYTLDELCTLYEYATPFERFFMLLGLNCGFGQAEIATLQLSEIRDSCIKRLRYKTRVYGEWRLWPQTVLAIEWAMKRRPAIESPYLVLTRQGRPLAELTKGNNRNTKIANTWITLLRRIKKDDEGFRKLSFNKLRKTAGDLVRELADDETASMFLCHGQTVPDELLERYTNRKFARVHHALDLMAAYLVPMFAKSEDPFPTVTRKPATSLGTIKRMRHLRQQGFRISKIAEMLGVSDETVRSHLRRG
jgi:hypothetical protein